MPGSIRRDIDEGVSKLKWFAALLSERVRVELTVFRLMYESGELQKRKEQILKTLGEEVFRLRGTETDIYATTKVILFLKEIEDIDLQLQETAEKASEISRIIT